MCSTERRIAPSIRPIEHAAFKTEKTGRTIFIMMSKPSPSRPSTADSGILTSRAVTGQESLPRRPRPSNGPFTVKPGEPDGTSQSVLAPEADTGFEDHTYAVACDAEVTQLLDAFNTMSPLRREAVPEGAQKWLRDPASLNASVLRCAPEAAAVRTSFGPCASSTADPQ